MREVAFELRLCAHLESSNTGVFARQLGAAVEGRRIVDVVCLEPGRDFDARAAITPYRIPDLAIESDHGPGRARYWKDAFDCHPDRARSIVDRAVEIGFFERERRNGREYVRQTARYPDWIGTIRGIENKPDLGTPGDLETQLLTDVKLGVLDEVILATESHVTGAHLNRIPEEVGVWRFYPETGEREVIREPTQLPTEDYGVELIERTPARDEVYVATPAEKERARRRIAERAYGKGWRPSDRAFCTHGDCEVVADTRTLTYCTFHDRLVDTDMECGSECAGYEPDTTIDQGVDPEDERARLSPWRKDPDGRQRRQADLDQFG